ncbi:hypothetical protein CHS0354_023160 [Potamilus streckersoni]|uniref:Uncharacterized protein n=1 Tax=Potamilus streckersoni TaxID=2493646 RepID=A0AAE0RNB7_9BIVA|nr:hypothetical protein CHS0354_023160 [Potamilus streckersoni]
MLIFQLTANGLGGVDGIRVVILVEEDCNDELGRALILYYVTVAEIVSATTRNINFVIILNVQAIIAIILFNTTSHLVPKES